MQYFCCVKYNKVYSNTAINSNHYIIKIRLKQPVEFYPGQYIAFYIGNVKRAYTPIHIDYSTNILTFLIKSYPNGELSNKICNTYKPDTRVILKGPWGNNYYDEDTDIFKCNNKIILNRDILMFACGTGITPFYSIITNLCRYTKYNVSLYASFKTRADVLLNDIEMTTFISDENNRLTAEKIYNITSKYLDAIVCVCGTESYMDLFKNIDNVVYF